MDTIEIEKGERGGDNTTHDRAYTAGNSHTSTYRGKQRKERVKITHTDTEKYELSGGE